MEAALRRAAAALGLARDRLTGKNAGWLPLTAHGSELVSRLHLGVEVSDLSVQLALAKAGVGVAVVSALGASHPEAARLHFAPLTPRIERRLFLLTRRDARAPTAVRALEATLLEETRSARLHPLVRFNHSAESCCDTLRSARDSW